MAKDLTKQPLNLEAATSKASEMWRELSRSLDTIEQAIADAAGDPAMLRALAKKTTRSVHEGRWLAVHRMRTRFGIELSPAFWSHGEQKICFPGLRVVDENLARPKNLIETADRLDLLARHMILETVWFYMGFAEREASMARHARAFSDAWWLAQYGILRECNLPDPSEAALRTYLYVRRSAPVALYGAWASESGSLAEAQRLQGAAAATVAGAVHSGIRLYPDLREALAEQGSPGKVLLRELPAAVLTELADLDHLRRDTDSRAEVLNKLAQEGLYKILRNRTANRLRTSNGEVSRSWELNEASTQAGKTDSDLEDFEISETLRQQRQQLDHLQEVANLSPQQNEIFNRVRRGMEIKEIAAELGISENQVSVQKHNAMKKLSQAREAAGF